MNMRIAAGLVGSVVLLTACGSTVQGTGPGPLGAQPTAREAGEDTGRTLEGLGEVGTGDGLAALESSTEAAPQPAVPRADEGSRANAPGREPDPEGDRAPEQASGRSGRAATNSALQGVTDDAIKVGFAWLDDRNQAGDMMGIGTDFGDPRQVIEIMVDWVNANGGLNGRELIPSYRPYTTGEANDERFAETLCTEFVQDRKVYAGIFNEITEPLIDCLAKGGVPGFNARPVSSLDRQAFERDRGFLYHTTGLGLTQNAVLTAKSHVAMGHLTRESTVGVVTLDDPSYARAAEVFRAELERHGVTVAETVLVNFWGGDYGSAQIANAVLRFRQEGIDKVATFDQNGLMWFQFATAAEAQGYRPTYALNPSSYANWWAGSGQMAAAQMEGSKGIGIHTIMHVTRDSEPHPPPGRPICREILDAAGMPAGSEDDEGTQLQYCDMVRLLKLGLDQADDLSPGGLQRSMESLGRAFQPGLGLGSYHGPDHHAGAGQYFEFGYGRECNCFQASGQVRNIPGTPS